MQSVSALRAPAWPAELELGFARRGDKTVIERRRHRGPLLVQRPFHPEADGTCHVYVLHPPGGVVGGDELVLDAEAARGASALLTTPAATKLYRTNGARASLRQTFRVGSGASLEWLPQETIAFGGSQATSTTSVHLEAGARYLGWEITCLGRPASGDDFSTGSFRQCTEIRRNGRLILIDRTHADSAGALRRAAWGWAGRSVYATLVATTASTALLAALRASVTPECAGDLFAVTTQSELTICRWLGSSTEQARRALGAAWSLIRAELLGKPACPPRIWTT
ncbi:MAG TPA: urease accessory protein UreD [Polyangiaceae bacterium]|nr:urease accessory protein UreD [Polyangiaceae bacterium]